MNTSGVAIQAKGSANRDAVLYNGAAEGWISKADNDNALNASTSENWNGNIYYATGVNIGINKNFNITVPEGVDGSTITFPFTIDENGNTTIESVENPIIFGFHINGNESDPSAAVTYLESAVGYIPAYMDYNINTFNYGSWKNAFFMPRPCMLKYDGTVDYYLDPNDYSKKEDGITSSDIADFNYIGNAMMEWGQNNKKIWYKIVPDTDDDTSASIYISDTQVDENYKAWSFINNQGEMVNHFYTPIYNGTIDTSGKLRSISGKTYSELCQSKTAANEIVAAEKNNGNNTTKLWFVETYADVTLINLLLILIGKNLNTQATFGNGRINQSSAAENMLGTGTMDDKGLFWGSNSNNYGVKVFGMENYWGNQWRRYAGHVMIDYVHKYKMTRGRADGSTLDDYVSSNTASDYNGYITGPNAPQTNNYVKTMSFNGHGFFTKEVGSPADSSHRWCDYWWQASGLRYAFRGGDCGYGLFAGAFFVRLAGPPAVAYWALGAGLSCKPIN